MSKSGRPEAAAARLRTTLRGGSRFSGSGITEDDYSENSMGPATKRMYRASKVPSSPDHGAEWEALNGPVVVIQPGRKDGGAQ